MNTFLTGFAAFLIGSALVVVGMSDAPTAASDRHAPSSTATVDTILSPVA